MQPKAEQLIPLLAREPEQLQAAIENLHRFLTTTDAPAPENALTPQQQEVKLFLTQTIQRLGKVNLIDGKQQIIEVVIGYDNIKKMCKLFEAEYDLSIDPTLIFDYPTGESQTQYFCETVHGDAPSD